MPNINITVANKIATNMSPGTPIVCGNSDYTVTFTGDAEWAAHALKTARFVFVKDGAVRFQDVVFSGRVATVPMLYEIDEVYVGVYAGDLRTTTPARILCDRSILCGGGTHEKPQEDIYNQILALCNQIAGASTAHLSDTDNPHKTTAQQVGARPDTWMPTAAEVGARPDTWMPTAAEVGARPDTWMPTAAEVGARPDTWTPSAAEVGARPDTWTPTAAEIGAAPAGFGLGLQYNGIPEIKNLTELDNVAVNNGWYRLELSDESVCEGRYSHGLISVNADPFTIEQILIPRNTDTKVVRLWNQGTGWGQWEYPNPGLPAGVEYRTTERWQGKVVYTKLVNIGTLPDTAQKTINVGINGSKWYEIHGHAADHQLSHGVAFPSTEILGYIDNNGVFYLTTTGNFSGYDATVTLKYVKD